MYIKPPPTIGEQFIRFGCKEWQVARLIQLSKDFEVFDLPLRALNINYTLGEQTLRSMVQHIEAVNSADLSYPIILDEDGEIFDGRHRVMRALLDGAESIKAVRFDENPSPCREMEE